MPLKILAPILLIIGAALGAVLTLFFSASDPIAPGLHEEVARHHFEAQQTTLVQRRLVTEWHEAVGTVRPRTESQIEAQVTAQILEVRVDSGQRVAAGDLLIRLDDRQLASRREQARQAVKSAMAAREQARQSVFAAEAALTQAETAHTRTQTYFESRAATAQDVEASESAFRQAQAGLARAREGLAGTQFSVAQAEESLKEAEIAISYTRIQAPADGEVLQRRADPGDLAVPGKPLLILQTSGQMMLEAHVREGLIASVRVGMQLPVSLGAGDQTIDARVDEIAPYADARSRTFLVKAALPELPNVYSGMFGKLLIPVGEHDAVLIPRQAVRRVGQLELVWVQDPHWQRRFIQTGQRIDNLVEVLSGLEGLETIGWRELKGER